MRGSGAVTLPVEGNRHVLVRSARVTKVLDPHRVGGERHRPRHFKPLWTAAECHRASSRPGSERCYTGPLEKQISLDCGRGSPSLRCPGEGATGTSL
jgi:hypothetical protein